MSEASESAAVTPLPGTDEHRVQQTGVLLRVPRWVGDLPDHDVVYALRGGRVGRCALARYRVPIAVRDRVLVTPGTVSGPALATLPLVAEIVDRVAPWLTVHLVPRLATRGTRHAASGPGCSGYSVGARVYTPAGGVCYGGEETVLASLASGPTCTVGSVCHELLHASWWRLSDAAREVLSAAAAHGHTWGSDYHDDPEERVARLFECWSLARLEGMPQDDLDELTVEAIFAWVWSGGLADHQVRHGLVPGHEALLVRRGLQPLPPPRAEPLPAPPPRPSLGDVVCDWVWDRLADGVYGVGRGARWAWRKAAAA